MVKEKIRIIPKIEIKNEYLIKGIKYEGLRKIGDPVKFAYKYFKDHADQINIIDIVASLYTRNNLFNIINKITENIFIPICVGGGIKNINDIKSLLCVGADRIIINSEGIRNINFLREIKNIFGDQFLTVSIEAKKIKNEYFCMMDHGRENSNIRVIDWIKELHKIKIGEIIINSIDCDGMQCGFDYELAKLIPKNIEIPIVFGGGAGKISDFENLINNFNFNGISAASCFHFNNISIKEIKKRLKTKRFNINF